MSSELDSLFAARFPEFGINKSREIMRLIYEISSKECVAPETVLNSLEEKSYQSAKNALLVRRYPLSFKKAPLNSYYLPKYETDPALKADISDTQFAPKNVYYQKKALESPLFDNVKKLFPDARYSEIGSVKEFVKGSAFSLAAYNKRRDSLFLTEEKYDFFKKCPCTKNVLNCGYSVMNIGMGCPYECAYCFLQGYQNVPGIVIPFNIGEYLSGGKTVPFAEGFFTCKRMGSGEFTDSLVFDHITEFSKPITDFFKKQKTFSSSLRPKA